MKGDRILKDCEFLISVGTRFHSNVNQDCYEWILFGLEAMHLAILIPI